MTTRPERGGLRPMKRFEFPAEADGELIPVVVDARNLVSAMLIARGKIVANFRRRGLAPPGEIKLNKAHLLAPDSDGGGDG